MEAKSKKFFRIIIMAGVKLSTSIKTPIGQKLYVEFQLWVKLNMLNEPCFICAY